MERYIKLGKQAADRNQTEFFDKLNKRFGYLHNKNEMDNLGLKLQVCVKQSRPLYLHGYLLTSALNNYLQLNQEEPIVIFETGTARGFSSIAMAKVLYDLNKNNAIIHTLDREPHTTPFYSNCYLGAKKGRKVSRQECIEEWKEISDKYITFHCGDSSDLMTRIQSEIPRINLAFLDGSHEYKNIKDELEFVENKQISGDIIICDDYTKNQFPEICKAVDDFIHKQKYKAEIFYGSDGIKLRGYVYMIKK